MAGVFDVVGQSTGPEVLKQGPAAVRPRKPLQLAWILFAASVAVCDVWLLKAAWHVCAHKAYAIDEFYYTHRAWTLVTAGSGLLGEIAAQGRFVCSLLWYPWVAVGGSDPARMILVRRGMFPLLLLTLGCLGWVSYRREPVHRIAAALTALLFALSGPGFIWHVVEIRPDGVALMFLVLSAALLYGGRRGSAALAAAAGFSLLLCCLSTAKAVVYCSAFAPALLVDLSALGRGREARILRRPLFFLLGFGGGALAIVLVLWLEQSPGEFVHRLFRGALEHERYYPRLPKSRYLVPYLQAGVALWVFGLVGLAVAVAESIRAWRRQGVFLQHWLWIMLYFSTLASFLLQKAPYPYSLLAWSGVQSVLAARGALRLLDSPALSVGMRRMLLIGAAVGTPVIVFAAGPLLRPQHTNHRQIELQRMIGELVGETDTVYDLSATYVYRPRAHRFAFVDTARKARYWSQLGTEVPRSLIDNRTMLFVYDTRFHTAPDGPLKRFILKHYQRYNNDLYIWGRRWDENRRPFSDTFLAPRASEYFVFPPEVAAAGVLRIDGRPVRKQVFHLERGEHRVSYRPGRYVAEELFLIWLPRDGKTFDPTRPAPPYYLGRHILP